MKIPKRIVEGSVDDVKMFIKKNKKKLTKENLKELVNLIILKRQDNTKFLEDLISSDMFALASYRIVNNTKQRNKNDTMLYTVLKTMEEIVNEVDIKNLTELLKEFRIGERE